LVNSPANPKTKKYISNIPTDPKSTSISYSYALSGSTYQLAAALEGDGTTTAGTGMTAYVVGNSITDIIDANVINPKGVYMAGASPYTPTNCTTSTKLTNNAVCTNLVAGVYSPANCSCLPYDPR
jgi:hypothetical protein